VKIDIPRLLLHLRSEITESQTGSGKSEGRATERLAFKLWAKVMTRPWLYQASARMGRLLQKLIVKDGKIGKVNSFGAPLIGWTSGRDLRPLEARSFRERWRSELAKGESK
jgi:L-lactate dehydrogenase complex protein LldF